MPYALIRTVFLLRHAQEEPGTSGPSGGGLSPLGRSQAASVATRLEGYAPERLVTSSLLRAAETAAIVARRFESLTPEIDDDLRECIPVVPDGFAERFAKMDPARLEANQVRLERAWGRYFEDPVPGRVVLVAHGNVIRYLIARVLGAPVTHWARMDIQNAGLCRVDWREGAGRQLTGFNDVGHLPLDLQTFT
jgi:serine/threonine-protein phosphatase PGAM5